MRHTLRKLSLGTLAVLASLAACDDPTPGPIGGLVFIIRTTPATVNPELLAIDRIEIRTRQVLVVHSETPNGAESQVLVDSQERTIELRNISRDRLVAQYQVPVGYIHQIRIFPRSVTLHLKDGGTKILPPGPNLPSWDQSGWKVVPIDDRPWPIVEDQLTGVRALFDFEALVLHNKGRGYKLRPTVPGEAFAVNPPPGEAGVFMDQVTVVFKHGTTASDVDMINSQIGASVLIAPILGTAYRIKLPSKINLRDAFEFFRVNSAVQGVLPAINYPVQHVEDQLFPNEFPEIPGVPRVPFNMQVADLAHGWYQVQTATGSVGNRAIRVGIIDNGVNIDTPDLAMNIAINQGEIPAGLMVNDTDGDGIISFVDLNAPENLMIRPPDVNMNGIVDGVDLISAWSNHVDEDDFDMNPNTFVDDIVGWDFFNNTNDPRGNTIEWGCDFGHGTCVASNVGAVGNNGMGTAGVSWAASIVPLRADTGLNAIPDVTFIGAARYSEAIGIDIVNTSMAWNIASENAHTDCANKKKQSTLDVPQEDFDKGIESGRNAFRTPPFVNEQGIVSSRVLYIFAAGNSAFNLADPNIVGMPAELLKAVIGSNVLIVGSSFDHGRSSHFSNYGSQDFFAHLPIVELWAPGEEVFSGYGAVTPSGRLAPFGGTSAAAPVVAGLAALVLSRFPSMVGHPQGLHDHLIIRANPTISVEPQGCPKEDNQPRLYAGRALEP